MLEPAGPGRRPVAVAPERVNKCIRVGFKPARTVLSIRDNFDGQLLLTSVCSDVRLPMPLLQREFFLTAWNDATQLRAMPLAPPYPPGPWPYVTGEHEYVAVRKGETKAISVSEPATAFFPGPGRFTLVATYTPRSGAPVPEDVLTSKDGPFNRSTVKINVTK